jgi:hypothetical protein
MPLVNLRTGLGTLNFISFLTQLWASVAGEGGLGPLIQELQIEVEFLTGSVAALAAKVAIIFGMHGDGTLTQDGELTVTSTNGVPFAPSATTDTTIADNIKWGTLPTLQLPVWLFQWSTIDELPDPDAGNGILCTDLGGGPGVIMADGSAWRRTSAGLETQVPAPTISLQVLTNAEEQYQSAALTANMVVTLTNDILCYPGARFRWVRAGAGAFTLAFKDSLSGATLYTSAVSVTETVEFLYADLAWVLAQHSAL